MTTGTRPSRSSTICPAKPGCRRCCSSIGLAVPRLNGRSPCAYAVISVSGGDSIVIRRAADLRDWLRPGAIEGRTANELMACAEDRLREWRAHAASHQYA